MPKIKLVCKECYKPYEKWPSQAARSSYCSRHCLQAYLSREVRSKHKAPHLRKLNEDPAHQKRAARAASKKRQRSSAFARKNKYKRHRGTGRHEHRVVAERVIGRYLTPDEIVHHIDEDKTNNDPSNLVIGITRSYHKWIHDWLKRNYDDSKKGVLMLRKRKGKLPGLRYKFKTKPFVHQMKALKKLIFRRGGALFMEMGTGKTKVAIDFAAAMHIKAGVDRVVIVCPKSVISVWKIELKKHMPEKIRKKLKVIIINYDQLPDREVKDTIYEGRKHVLRKFMEAGTCVFIADESHMMKKPSARRTKAMYWMSKAANYKVMLTGTPLTKDVLDLYAQFKWLDERIFGTNFNHFKRRYCVYGGYGGYQLLRYINLRELKDKAKPYIFQAKKEDCLDLPSRTDQVVPIKLSRKTKPIYDEMAKEGLVTVNGEEYNTEVILTKVLRLQQISSGFLKKKDGTIDQFGHEKEKQLSADLADMAEQDVKKVVIFCQFVQDLKVCAKVAQEHGYRVLLFHGDVSNNDRERRLADFDEADDRVVFIAQNDAGSMGISLTAASTAIHYSATRKYATEDQLKGRLHRIGQHHPVLHKHYVCEGVDQGIWLANKLKKDVAELALTKPHLLMASGYDLG